MLPKINRLHKDADIKRLMASGKTFFLPQFIFKFKPSKQENTRIAFVVSNKVSKKATVRNLLKRQLRHATKELLPELSQTLDLAIIAKPSSLDLDYAELKKQVTFAFGKIGMKKK